MTAQLKYAPTPTYSFPLPTLILPEKLVELSLESMSGVAGCLQPSTDPIETLLSEVDGEPPLPIREPPSIRYIPLEPLEEETAVIGVDTSSVKVGETDMGVICAVRGAVVWRTDGKYRYLRVGPLLFHITDEDGPRLLRRLQRRYLGVSGGAGAPYPTLLQVRFAGMLDHLLQMNVSQQTSNSIILRDGSLTVRSGDALGNALPQLLRAARDRGNVILAFTKVTRLRLLGRSITSLAAEHKPPCLLEIQGLSTSKQIKLLGRVYVARLGWEPYSFRLDVDRELPSEACIDAVRRLLHNDLIFQGYPEVLRLAHVLSTFTAIEVLAIQRYVSGRYGLKVAPQPSIRRMLFGPYGTSREAS